MTRKAAIFCLITASVTVFVRSAAAQPTKPNIVHIFADDMGWGSVGFNGQELIETPNLDDLARDGIVLNNSYAATLCGPSRSMLYTGFHQGHGVVDSNGEIGSGFRQQDVMTAQLLQQAGYRSAVFGKWGFGASGSRVIGPADDPAPNINNANSLPTAHGYSDFYGLLNHSAAHDYYYDWMWQSDAAAPNGVSLDQNDGGPSGAPQYSHDLFAAKSETFIQQHAGDANPFYLQINYTIPHSDILAIEDAPGGFAQYANRAWTPEQKAYAAMISRMDASIGEVVKKLDDPDGDGDKSDSVLDNTLILFSSDNGPTTADNAPMEFFDANGVYRGGKRDLYEGGIHVPTLAYWKGTIEPGQSTNYRTDLADFMATAADIAGVETPVGIDGVSILPTLTGGDQQRQREYLVFEHHEQDGPDADSRDAAWAIVRQDGMKLIRYADQSSDLFNLAADPSEVSPLNLTLPANAQLASELEAVALAEGVQQGTVEFRTWAGANGADIGTASNWSTGAAASSYWSAVAANNAAGERLAAVATDFTALGFEVRGNAAGRQTVEVSANRTLTGRNEVRISAGGRLELAGGAVETNRWINIRAGGQLTGAGETTGDVYNLGAVAPGRSPDLGPPTAGPIPAPLPPENLNTGAVTAVRFNFAGVQDDAPLNQTSTLSPYATLAHGFDFGPGLSPRNAANAGNEFNVQGFVIGGDLQDAIDNEDYLTFTLDPVSGAAITPLSVSFNLWRNGSGAAQDWAILSSADGFTTSDVLATLHITDSGSSSQHNFTATFTGAQAQIAPLEVRLYGWNATGGSGNTHVNAVSMNAQFIGVPTVALDFAGVQDSAPLTATRWRDENASVAAGLAFGAGVAPRNPGGGGNNAGNEFNVAGFTGTTLAQAIAANDYIGFAVEAIDGLALIPNSVSFELWRENGSSAVNYAILSSVDGFAAGDALVQIAYSDSGSVNSHTLAGTFASPQPTDQPVEFRLYGWGAAGTLNNTHITAASMRAQFTSIAGEELGPIGRLAVNGDFFHLAGGVLAIELGGLQPETGYDVLEVSGAVELEGNLEVTLADMGGQSFSPAWGDEFVILTAGGGLSGEFASAELPDLDEGLDWFVDYAGGAVTLCVMAAADFDRDGDVDGADLLRWEAGIAAPNPSKGNGDADLDGDIDGADFLTWQRQLGGPAAPTKAIHTPEPASLVMALLGVAAFATVRARARTRRA